MVDHERVKGLVRELLEAIGEDPNREGLLETPRRVADMYVELFEGIEADPGEHLRVTFEAGHDEMVMVRDIPFTSLCEHHLVPFVGVAHVAYLPGPEGRITGLSKLARLVEGFARRLQVQERMTTEIVEAMEHELQSPRFDRGHRSRTLLHVDARREEGRSDDGHVGRARGLSHRRRQSS